MKPSAGNETLGRTLKWVQRALFACGVLLLGYCGFAIADSWVFERRESRDLDRLRVDLVANWSAPQPPSAASPHSLIGRIEIPRLWFSAVVTEGTDRTTLRRGIGHIRGTALPGQPGNVGLAGHRDTLFHPLKDLRIQDRIRFSTPRGDILYEVESLTIVDPDDVGILAASGENALTLVTCYPFSYIGPAPKRWIVRARQVSPPTLAPPIVK
jgi:sortase A